MKNLKIEKSNNPVAVAALLLVLAVIIGRIIWMLSHRDGQDAPTAHAATVTRPPDASGASTTPASSPAPAVVTPPAPVRYVAPVRRSDRDPFTRLTRHAADHAAQKTPLGLPSSREDAGASVTEVSPLPVMAVPMGRNAPAPSVPRVGSLIKATLRPKAAPTPPAAPDPMQGLTLTAIVGGTEPMAVLQTPQPQPMVVHVGDHVGDLTVTAIGDQAITFSQGKSVWTLPLQSAPAGPAATITAEDPPAVQETADGSQ